MEVSIVIKLPDGSTKTVDLINVNISTSWGNGHLAMPHDPGASPVLVGTLNLSGTIKDTSVLGSI